MEREEDFCGSWDLFPVAESLEGGGTLLGSFLRERLGSRDPAGLCCVHGFWSSAGGGHGGGNGLQLDTDGHSSAPVFLRKLPHVPVAVL